MPTLIFLFLPHQPPQVSCRITSNTPFGSHGLSKDPFYSQQLSGTRTAQSLVQTVRPPTVVSNTNKDWIFFPEGVPGFVFRIGTDSQTRNAAVSSADFEVSTQEGIFQVDNRSLNAIGIPTIFSAGQCSRNMDQRPGITPRQKSPRPCPGNASTLEIGLLQTRARSGKGLSRQRSQAGRYRRLLCSWERTDLGHSERRRKKGA